MNKDARIQKIQEIINRDKDNPFGKMEIPWNDKLESKNVYLIPLQYLVYNKYNGRILSRTQSLEKQEYVLNVESEEGRAKIEQLLFDSNKSRNETTLTSINSYGQQKVGIITRDGIIIDGNRRAMLLNRGKKFDYFKAVVLDVTLEEDPLQIEKLETTYQMGEDEKVGYNATEKYIKSKLLYKKLTQKTYSSIPERHTPDNDVIKKIATWMGVDISEVLKYLNTMEVMDEYLEFLEYDGIYTQLDKREDQFLNLTKWLKTFYGETSRKGFDGYENDDVDDLKAIAFDYIRAKYEGKEFRLIAEGQRPNHFFGDREIWNGFIKYHNERIKSIKEVDIDYNSPELLVHLNDRDSKFLESTYINGKVSFLEENIKIHEEKLGYNRASDEPQKITSRVLDALNAVKTGHKSFANPAVQKQMEEIGDKVFDMLLQKSTSKVLSHIIKLLEEIDVDKVSDKEKEEVLEKTKKIQKLSYEINKNL
ncbi:MAG TPA: hypothetical protein VK623_05120 [Flavobacterium sp.]|nr:hypothetical protein [Flavobacterium sp.]